MPCYRRMLAGCVGLLLFAWLGCRSPQGCSSSSAPDGGLGACPFQTHTFLNQQAARYRQAMERSRQWLDQVNVDPMELRERGIKGKKRLVEQLDAYYRLWQISDAEQQARLLARIKQVVAITYEPRYHDMSSIDEVSFKQDSTSYLRAALLMERLGLDSTLYRKEIRKIHPRLNQQMKARGPNQQLVFHWYYQHFGLEEPFPLGNALTRGFIANRSDPATFSAMDTYQLTHEVFVPYEFGEKLDAQFFNQEDMEYLRRALDLLTARFIEKGNSDLVAELCSCLRYLRLLDLPVYQRSLGFLLDSQHPDGSWGNLAKARKAYGEYAAQGEILHTTMVVLEALSVAFHPPWNENLFKECGE